MKAAIRFSFHLSLGRKESSELMEALCKKYMSEFKLV